LQLLLKKISSKWSGVFGKGSESPLSHKLKALWENLGWTAGRKHVFDVEKNLQNARSGYKFCWFSPARDYMFWSAIEKALKFNDKWTLLRTLFGFQDIVGQFIKLQEFQDCVEACAMFVSLLRFLKCQNDEGCLSADSTQAAPTSATKLKRNLS